MNNFISKILLLLIFSIGTINCSKITFSPINQDQNNGSEPEPPVTPPVVILPQPKQLDLLIVIDNSSSMLPEHSVIAEKLANFTSKLSGIDYKIAVTTTDARIEIDNGFFGGIKQTPRGFGGKVLSFNGQNFISPNTPNAESLILSSLDRSLEAACGSSDMGDNINYWEDEAAQIELCSVDYEEPTKVIQQVLQQKDTTNVGFLRQDADFVALIITDEDVESAEDENLNMSQELSSIISIKTKFKAYGIIAQENDISNCQANWSGETSQKVQEFIGLSGGSHSSICDNDYSSIFDRIVQDFR